MRGITILNQANAPMGPFTREQVAEKLQRGEVTLGSLAFVDGLSQWTPLRDVLARVDAAAPPPTTAPAPAPGVSVPPVAAPVAPALGYSYAATMEPPPHLVYAGFWLRVVATLIDSVVLMAGFAVILGVWFGFVALTIGLKGFGDFQPSSSSTPADVGSILLLGLLEIGLVGAVLLMGWLYHAVGESSAWQGTLGKRVLNLRVTGMSGERISFWHATGRFLARTVATLPFCIGYVMAAFTARKQALHDMIASTLVVRN